MHVDSGALVVSQGLFVDAFITVTKQDKAEAWKLND